MRQTGVRVGDAVRVRGSDISFEDGRYILRLTAQKTGKPIEAAVSDALGDKLARKGDRYCFPSERDSRKHISRQTVWRWLKSAAKRSGVELDGTSPHSFRKCFAVRLMHDEGLSAVQEALQHSNDSVSRIYAYADTVMRFDSDEPIRWRDLEYLCDYLLDRLAEK